MTESTKAPTLSRHLKRQSFALAAAWTAVLITAAGWYFHEESEVNVQSARTRASISLESDLSYLRWFATHRGVYIPVTEVTRPDPYLSHLKHRDVTTKSGLDLTLANPAHMTHRVDESGRVGGGYLRHVTSLKPIRTENAADAWETEALRAFERGETEVAELAMIQGAEYLRLMRPLIAEESCLNCHEVQRHEVGDILGGSSVSVPMAPLWASMHSHWASVAMVFGLIWLLGLGGIGFGASRMGRRIREREQAEQALSESKRVLLESQEVARIGSYVLDLASGAWESSAVLDRVFGIGRDYERTARGWLAIVHPDDRQTMTDYLEHEVVEGRGRFDKEYRIVRHDDGVERWVLGLGALKFDAGGRPQSMIGTIQDITERKHGEKERELLSVAIDQAAEGVLITDAEGTIQYVNPAFEEITGYSRADALGKTPRMLKSGEQDEAFYKDLWDTIRRGDIWHGRLVNRRKDGTLYTEETIISPVRDDSGRTVNYVAVRRDITAGLRLEQQFHEAQKMESVGRLAGGVAHDFNNMLGVILGRAEMALDRLDPGQPPHAELAEIRMAAQRSADLTRQLLTFARRQTIAPVVLDLNETVEGMVNMLRRLIGEGIDLVWRPKEGVWPVKLDPSQIDQILANLCVNARDAIEATGKVTIGTENTTVDEACCANHPGSIPGEFVLLTVSDSGCGMDKDTIDRIYEPFFTTKEIGRGTGLGLSTVYGIVKQNKGFIEVSSEPGQGTTFKIYLPRHVAAARPPQEDPAESAESGSETILLVEDEPAILSTVAMMLEGQGYAVLTASTAAEAVRVAKDHSGTIHLLLTDVVMPEMNGPDLTEKLLSRYPSLRSLFMSGYTADVIGNHGVLHNGVRFIQKPFSVQQLAARVREALASDGATGG